MKILILSLLLIPTLASASVASDIGDLLDRFFGGDQTPVEVETPPLTSTPVLPQTTVQPVISTTEVRREIMQQEAELEAFEADLRAQEKASANIESQILTSQQQLQLVDQQIELNRRKLDFYDKQVKTWQELVETLTREKSTLRAQIRNKEREYQGLLSKKFIQKQNFQLNPTISWWQWFYSDKSVSELLNERRQSNVDQISQAEALANLDRLQTAFDKQEQEAVTALSTVSTLESQLLKDQIILNDLAQGKATLLAQLNEDETTAEQRLSQFRQEQSETTQYLQNLRYELTQAEEANAAAVTAAQSPVVAVAPTVLRWPIALPVTVNASFKDPEYETNYGQEHMGIDLVASQGTDVLAAAEGVVNKVTTDASGYSYLIIEHGPDLYTVYGHISNALVEEGEVVAAGQKVAWSGGTPGTPGAGFFTSGPHLHFEVFSGGQFVDPLLLLPDQ
ncbi:peptidoglycan DD-metalloendopeptidase family protein [Candidatus Peregrinibacteria bacterium]|nr:peptidoglycan DD-metalloendopeptidase family protein [bacterium]NCQ55965.1 peptidoglycan DD-metalloendopeptidase family protein [Candidatus Parcubacteria bacterium]NCS67990.1 peptidoglycan DD-metalloendopeptidase family protein [Candidatus Peregrinibacteria bacterium]